MAYESADLGGFGDGSSPGGDSFLEEGVDCSGLDSLLGGKAGVGKGVGRVSTEVTEELESILCLDSRLLSASLYSGKTLDFSASEYLASI